jgi:hypothetical protein
MLESNQALNEVDVKSGLLDGVVVGMTTCGVFAVLGKPDDVNATTTAHGTSVQLIYRSRRMYVYTEGRPNYGNGIVRAIQQ